ncbi:MAG: DEAD/DEAH box helicase family protein [Defluviitaleaceae bacterium]|nr:DEAD/DEAH box helicase family protein [Defluviitaleaceae bacterium]
MKKYAFLKEKPFQNEIFLYLVEKLGYQINKKEDYNYTYAIDTGKLFSFIRDTQSEEWDKFSDYYGDKAEEIFLQKLNEKIDKRKLIKGRYTGGLLNVLQGTIEDIRTGASIRIAYLSPSEAGFENINELYAKNILSVSYEFEYESSEQLKSKGKNQSNRVDLAIFINGIPVIMIETKKLLAGQSARFNGTEQYKNNRDPNELVFSFNKRVVAYFAVDEYEAYVTTQLDKRDSFFLPFNMGNEAGGSGNPQALEDKRATYYLWEQILQRDMILKIMREFVFEDIDKDNGKPFIIFPRFHQVDAVLECERDFAEKGVGGRYIIWHSAGSGKTITIALLAFRLLAKKDINTVIIISDRTVIDGQLRDQLIAVDNGDSRVKWAEGNSAELSRYINSGNMIVGTTLQKFPFILDQLASRKSKGYAIIIDEAHSSTSGMTMSRVSETFTGKSLKEAIKLEDKADEAEDGQTLILKQADKIRATSKVSYYAFTATPKKETQELFGTRNQRGKECFHKYTMKQAIEEDFILNPLACYKNMKAFYDIEKKKDSSEEYDEQRSKRKIFHHISSDDEVITLKSQEMLSDFCGLRMGWLGGQSKAMVVTPSRLHAVKYKFILDKLIRESGYKIKTVVAFTGKVKYGDNLYSESELNAGYKDKDIRKLIKNNPEVRIIIVADKLQTGFDEPLLCCMYVDKKFNSAVKAVQTLSRVNRAKKGKKTFVLDFVNDADDIKAYFEKYYDSDIFLPTMSETDPEAINRMKDEIFAYGLFEAQSVIDFDSYVKKENSAAIEKMGDAIKHEASKLDKDKRKYFYKLCTRFVKLYYYVGILLERWDEKNQLLVDFLREVVIKVLYEQEMANVINPSEFVSLAAVRLKLMQDEQEIPLESIVVEYGKDKEEITLTDKKYSFLDKIIEDLNATLSEPEKQDAYTMVDRVMVDEEVVRKVKNNTGKTTHDFVRNRVQDFILEKIIAAANGERDFYVKLANKGELLAIIAANIIAQLQGQKYVS